MNYRNAIVLGLGISGLGAARLLASEGCAVTIWEHKPESALDPARVQEARACGARLCCDAVDMPSDAFDIAIVSPGLALNAPMVQAAQTRGCPLLSELELGWSRAQSRVVAVTGSNGKSTVVKWLVESLQAGGISAAPAGNYGPSVCDVVRERPSRDVLVLEVSSFQLETVRAFRPDVGLLLNLLPNHLDRHGDMETYASMKARLFGQTRSRDVCLVPLERYRDMKSRAPEAAGRWMTFGSEPGADYAYCDGTVQHKGEILCDVNDTCFGNTAMGPAAAAVVGALHAGGWPTGAAAVAARPFEPLPHRVQPIAVWKGVTYINDSKSTNIAAMAHALKRVKAPVHLIAGGLPKEKDFNSLKEILAELVKSVYLIGVSSEVMYNAWSDTVPCLKCGTLDVALGRARACAVLGETVLFSPGCASFDQFKNYEERGEQFTRLVKQSLTEKIE